jgi:flagellar biosynthetic protein FliR
VIPFDALLEERVLVFLYALTRISALIIVAPAPWTVAPARVRAMLAAGLALLTCASPLGVQTELSQQPLAIALGVISEACIGFCMGFTVRLMVSVAEVGAEFVAPQLGLGVAALFDPHMHTSETPIGSIYRNMTILLAVIVGLHRQLLMALFGSFGVLPPGVLVNPGNATGTLLALTAQAIEAGVRLALPAVVVLFLVQVALAFIARAAPALQIFSVGFAVTLGVGLLVLTLSLPDSVRLLLGEMSHLDTRIQAVLSRLAEASP